MIITDKIHNATKGGYNVSVTNYHANDCLLSFKFANAKMITRYAQMIVAVAT